MARGNFQLSHLDASKGFFPTDSYLVTDPPLETVKFSGSLNVPKKSFVFGCFFLGSNFIHFLEDSGIRKYDTMAFRVFLHHTISRSGKKSPTQGNDHTTWKVDGDRHSHWFIMAPYKSLPFGSGYPAISGLTTVYPQTKHRRRWREKPYLWAAVWRNSCGNENTKRLRRTENI